VRVAVRVCLLALLFVFIYMHTRTAVCVGVIPRIAQRIFQIPNNRIRCRVVKRKCGRDTDTGVFLECATKLNSSERVEAFFHQRSVGAHFFANGSSHGRLNELLHAHTLLELIIIRHRTMFALGIVRRSGIHCDDAELRHQTTLRSMSLCVHHGAPLKWYHGNSLTEEPVQTTH